MAPFERGIGLLAENLRIPNCPNAAFDGRLANESAKPPPASPTAAKSQSRSVPPSAFPPGTPPEGKSPKDSNRWSSRCRAAAACCALLATRRLFIKAL